MNPANPVQEVTVSVPGDRVAEFHVMFGHWLAGSAASDGIAGTAGLMPRPFAEATKEEARTWWNNLTIPARSLFGFLADHPDTKFTGGDLVAACSLETDSAGVAGLTSWPGKHAYRLGLTRPWHWDGKTNTYFVDSEMAQAILRARG